MSERRYERVRTYEKAWHLETILYAIGDKSLPFPLNITQIGFFCVFFIFFFIIYQIFPFLKLIPGINNKIFRFAFLPFIAMKFTLRQRINGKQPHQWIVGELRYWFMQPKRLCRFKKMNKHSTKFKFNGKEGLM